MGVVEVSTIYLVTTERTVPTLVVVEGQVLKDFLETVGLDYSTLLGPWERLESLNDDKTK